MPTAPSTYYRQHFGAGQPRTLQPYRLTGKLATDSAAGNYRLVVGDIDETGVIPIPTPVPEPTAVPTGSPTPAPTDAPSVPISLSFAGSEGYNGLSTPFVKTTSATSEIDSSAFLRTLRISLANTSAPIPPTPGLPASEETTGRFSRSLGVSIPVELLKDNTGFGGNILVYGESVLDTKGFVIRSKTWTGADNGVSAIRVSRVTDTSVTVVLSNVTFRPLIGFNRNKDITRAEPQGNFSMSGSFTVPIPPN